jgi:hypothetical protein
MEVIVVNERIYWFVLGCVRKLWSWKGGDLVQDW